MAKPKKITRDEQTGQLFEDGKPALRSFQPASYGRNGPPRRTGRPRKNAVPAIVEPEPVDDLE